VLVISSRFTATSALFKPARMPSPRRHLEELTTCLQHQRRSTAQQQRGTARESPHVADTSPEGYPAA
jgi:hypothetical protein